jgi:predicted ATPase/transcriptional regulator with XRE-family HTH domain
VPETPASFGELLRQVRSAASLSQEELAQRSGVSVRGISDLERGARSAPRLETVRLLADALDVDQASRAALLAAARPDIARRGATDREKPAFFSVPTPLTRLIGREAEVEALCTTLRRDDVRFVTLTGAGGSGKTRLATAVAVEMGDNFSDGVVFVDLSPLTDPTLVLPTIATTLGVREVVDQSLFQTLSNFLTSKQLLLVLDNCERVLAAAPDITTLLAASPGLVVLATSREPLHVRGEREFPVSPLPLAVAAPVQALAQIATIPAIALFVERAEASQPDFIMTTENVAAVAAICRRLDGLPLAIELAAARVKVLPPQALLARLEHRLPLLTGGGQDLPARQRTMRDAIAWSYDLLSPDEQALFRRLAVFAGGFTLGGADAVAVPDGHLAVLDGVVALVEQSLVRQIPGTDDEPRYRMLETVREFGLERLVSSGDEDDARQRHAEHFLRMSAELVESPATLMNHANLTRLVAEHDNVRLALAWCDQHGEIDALLQLSSLLYGLWFSRGLYREGAQWVDRALERSQRVPSSALIRALGGAGTLASFQGDYARATSFYEEGLAMAQALGDPSLMAEALTYSAFLAYRHREFARAEQVLAEARHILVGSAGAESGALPFLTFGGVVPFFHIGDLALVQGQFAQAATEYEEGIVLFKAAGSESGLRDLQAGLAAVRYLTGDFPEAAALYGESLQQSHAMAFWPLVVSSLLGLAGIAIEVGDPARGARLLGAAEGIASSLGSPMYTREDPVMDRVLATVRLALDEQRFADLREAGRALSIEAAIGEALTAAEAGRSSLIAAD